jgi:transmembrane sensor
MDRFRPEQAGHPALRGTAPDRVAAADRNRSPWLAAAAVLLCALLGGALSLQGPGMVWAVLADHHAGAMGRKDVALPDGSSVVLGAGSALSVAFDGTARRVVLHGGEAYFSVAPDAAHPFIVEAGDGTVTVTGTKFDVKIAGDHVTVAVQEGTVSVAAGAGPPLALTPGRTAQFNAKGVQPGETVDVSDVGSWRDGHLVFQGTPLADVLADLERYRGGHIFVTDAELAALPVTGVFETGRSDAALETVARALPVKITRITDYLVFVGPAE